MNRKECEIRKSSPATEGGCRPALRAAPWIAITTSILFAATPALQAGTVRIWPNAVVISDHIQLGDVAELRGFDVEAEADMRATAVADAPPLGGSRVIHIDLVRTAVQSSGVNMATVGIGGATRCAITRPAISTPTQQGLNSGLPSHASSRALTNDEAANANSSSTRTLRQSVVDHFDAALARYGGKAEIIFDRTDEQVLNLHGERYDFKIVRRGGRALGLVSVEVRVSANGKLLQTVPLVVQVNMVKAVVVADRSINQGATVRDRDVKLTQMTFSNVGAPSLDEPAMVIGQRSKKFIPAGTLLEPELLESVPLVVRGQLVTLTSIDGPVSVVTTGKAASDGLLGEVVTVRSADNKRVTFDGIVVGPGHVELGGRYLPRLSGVATAAEVRP